MSHFGRDQRLLDERSWPSDDHLDDIVFLGRAVKEIGESPAFSLEDLVPFVLRCLITERLKAVTILVSGEIIEIPPAIWRVNGRERLFSCSITEREARGLPEPVLPGILMALEYQRREARDIYATDDSLDLLLGHPAAPILKAKRRGAPGDKKASVVAAMQLIPAAELNAMKQKEMEHRFGVSQTTCREAREIVQKLRQLPPNSAER